MKQMAMVLAATALFGANVFAKEVDLSAFDGTYKGKGTFRGEGLFLPLTAKAKFVVAKNGRAARVVLSGLVSGEGYLAWGTTLKLRPNGRLTTSNIVTLHRGVPIAASGRFSVPKTSRIEGSSSKVVGEEEGQQRVTLLVQRQGKRKKRLQLEILVLVNDATILTYAADLTGR